MHIEIPASKNDSIVALTAWIVAVNDANRNSRGIGKHLWEFASQLLQPSDDLSGACMLRWENFLYFASMIRTKVSNWVAKYGIGHGWRCETLHTTVPSSSRKRWNGWRSRYWVSSNAFFRLFWEEYLAWNKSKSTKNSLEMNFILKIWGTAFSPELKWMWFVSYAAPPRPIIRALGIKSIPSKCWIKIGQT